MRAEKPWALAPTLSPGGARWPDPRDLGAAARETADTAWMAHAACKGHDLSLFYHPDTPGDLTAALREAKAKAVCHTCPVINDCLSYAEATHELYGVWGGLSERERQQRRLARAACGHPGHDRYRDASGHARCHACDRDRSARARAARHARGGR